MRQKRLGIPKFWKTPKKVKKWVVAPSAGPHKKFESIPLAVIMRDVLHITDTGSEARKIVKAGEILVDGRKRKDYGYPVGLFDVISIPKLNQNYRVVPTSKGLEVIKISSDESNKKILKIINKKILKKEKLQLNFHDGKNIFVGKDEYRTGDSLLLQLPELKILDHMKLEKGNLGIVSKGVDSGKMGTIKEVVKTKAKESKKISVNLEGTVENVLKDRFFVIGRDKPLITVSE